MGLINDEIYVYQVSAVDTSGNEGTKSLEVSGIPTESPVVTKYGWTYGSIYLNYLDDILLARNTTVCISSETDVDQIFCTTTNRIGEYIIEDVPIGSYSIQAEKNEYTSSKPSIEINENSLTNVDPVSYTHLTLPTN